MQTPLHPSKFFSMPPFLFSEIDRDREPIYPFAQGEPRFNVHAFCRSDGTILHPLQVKDSGDCLVPSGYLPLSHDRSAGIPNKETCPTSYPVWLNIQITMLSALSGGTESIAEKLQPVFRELTARVFPAFDLANDIKGTAVTPDRIRNGLWDIRRFERSTSFFGSLRGSNDRDSTCLLVHPSIKLIWHTGWDELWEFRRALQMDPLFEASGSEQPEEPLNIYNVSEEQVALEALKAAEQPLHSIKRLLARIRALESAARTPDLLDEGVECRKFYELLSKASSDGLIPSPRWAV